MKNLNKYYILKNWIEEYIENNPDYKFEIMNHVDDRNVVLEDIINCCIVADNELFEMTIDDFYEMCLKCLVETKCIRVLKKRSISCTSIFIE